jgi:hypothetical protein
MSWLRWLLDTGGAAANLTAYLLPARHAERPRAGLFFAPLVPAEPAGKQARSYVIQECAHDG